MWQFLGGHYDLALGVLAVAVWIGAIIWFLQSTGLLADWRKQWRERRDRVEW